MAKRAKAGAALAMVAALTLGGVATAADKGTVTGVSDKPAAAASPVVVGEPVLGDAELASLGCAITGTAATAASYIAGPSEAIMLLGGGLLVPSNSTILGLSLLAAIGASTCSIGATLTPTVLWAYDQSDNLAAEAGRMGKAAAKSVAGFFGWPQAPEVRVLGAAPALQ